MLYCENYNLKGVKGSSLEGASDAVTKIKHEVTLIFERTICLRSFCLVGRADTITVCQSCI